MGRAISAVLILVVAVTLLLPSAALHPAWNQTVRRLSSKHTHIEWPNLMYAPKNYPVYKPLLQVLQEWNPDNPDAPNEFKETLQHFNYSDPIEREIATKFREAELPFKVYGVPNINEVVEKWTNEYLSDRLKRDGSIRTERSKNNHFMFWKRKNYKGFKQPTDYVSMSFDKWVSLAEAADRDKTAAETEHYYFHKSEPMGARMSTFVGRDLRDFSTPVDNFFISKVSANKGIQCRFGMRGIIAETHYDSGRNMVAMLKGSKRYILTPPSTCKYLGIISEVKHPSYRHSVIDWSDMNQARASRFDQVSSIDTILRTGEVLYIPSFWFHYIISLEYSIQCNSRSGPPPSGIGKQHIQECFDRNI